MTAPPAPPAPAWPVLRNASPPPPPPAPLATISSVLAHAGAVVVLFVWQPLTVQVTGVWWVTEIVPIGAYGCGAVVAGVQFQLSMFAANRMLSTPTWTTVPERGTEVLSPSHAPETIVDVPVVPVKVIGPLVAGVLPVGAKPISPPRLFL